MYHDHRSLPARGRYFPLAFGPLLSRLAAFPGVHRYDGSRHRLYLHLRNCRIEGRHGLLLCALQPFGYFVVFSLPDRIAPAYGRRAVEHALEQLRTLVPAEYGEADPRALGLHRAYLGPLGRITITRPLHGRRSRGPQYRRA